MLRSLILYLKGMRIMMFQLSGFFCRFLSSTVLTFLFRVGEPPSRLREAGLGF